MTVSVRTASNFAVERTHFARRSPRRWANGVPPDDATKAYVGFGDVGKLSCERRGT